MSQAMETAASSFAAPDDLGRIQRPALVVGLVGLVACIVGALTAGEQIYTSWLIGWFFWVGISLGSLALLMIQHLASGSWGLMARRVFEAAALGLPLLLLLGAPLFYFGFDRLFPWARPDEASPLLQALLEHKGAYLNPGGFWLRFAVYFAVWIGLALLLRRLSLAQDTAADPLAVARRLRVVSAPGLVLYAFTLTFACFDWLMSVEPEWFSTIFGVYNFGGAGMAALAFLVLIQLFLRTRQPLARYLEPKQFHDWGKLMLAFVMLWAYFAVSQFLIIWSGNQGEEIGWYLHRMRHGWGVIGGALILLHFAVPFALLLSRDLKRKPQRLAWVAAGLLVMHWIDLYWQVVPAFYPDRPAFHWLDLAAPLAVGGLWVAWVVAALRRRPVIAYNDPLLAEMPEASAAREVPAHG